MLQTLLLFLGVFFVFVGCVFTLLAAVGIVRFTDAFLRMHAATKAGVAGAGLILLGIGCLKVTQTGSWYALILAVLTVAFMLITTPLSSHIVARTAYRTGAVRHSGTVVDEWQNKP